MLYRGSNINTIGFDNILVVTNIEDAQISVPSYLLHNSNSTYFYVVRRSNNCGKQEHTLSAFVKVSIDANGDLVKPQPNGIFEATAKQVADYKVQLVWFYCSLGQKSAPIRFNIYYDSGTGVVDYENKLAAIAYTGRKFYSYESDTLDVGTYLFAIRAEDAEGTENSSLAKLKIQVDITSPDVIDFINTTVG